MTAWWVCGDGLAVARRRKAMIKRTRNTSTKNRKSTRKRRSIATMTTALPDVTTMTEIADVTTMIDVVIDLAEMLEIESHLLVNVIEDDIN
jgi:hypothetical protein